jgi:hypothetical protein
LPSLGLGGKWGHGGGGGEQRRERCREGEGRYFVEEYSKGRWKAFKTFAGIRRRRDFIVPSQGWAYGAEYYYFIVSEVFFKAFLGIFS